MSSTKTETTEHPFPMPSVNALIMSSLNGLEVTFVTGKPEGPDKSLYVLGQILAIGLGEIRDAIACGVVGELEDLRENIDAVRVELRSAARKI